MLDIAIMYHYVREKDWKGIVPLDPLLFEQQIDILSKTYDIVSPDDLKNPIKHKPRCVLTFDDGTKDQFTNAYQIMKRKGVPGYFTVMSEPLVNRTIPVFHLVHAVLSFFSDEEIWSDLNELYELNNVPQDCNIYAYEKELFRRYNKYTFNFVLPEAESKKFLEAKLLSFFSTKESFIEQYYINKKEFIEMKEAGMTIGVHCVNHLAYSGDARDFYLNEIEPCKRFMSDEMDIRAEWYTPSFGGGEHFKQLAKELTPILLENGFIGGFNTIPGKNEGLNQFWLNRYDCINAPPFKPII